MTDYLPNVQISLTNIVQEEDEAGEEDKMNILVQLFWICIAILESDYEHEFILGLRLLDKVTNREEI